MKSSTINKQQLKKYCDMKTIRTIIGCLSILFISISSFAQEKVAKIDLSFAKVDSEKVCTVKVTSADSPVAEMNVQIYVKRLFSLLPLGKGVTTDETGTATLTFPEDLPGDDKGELQIVAKIEDDENYGTVVADAKVNWGLIKEDITGENERALWASREKAPIFFMVFTNLIILGVWGTLIYCVLQVFKIKRISSLNKK